MRLQHFVIIIHILKLIIKIITIIKIIKTDTVPPVCIVFRAQLTVKYVRETTPIKLIILANTHPL